MPIEPINGVSDWYGVLKSPEAEKVARTKDKDRLMQFKVI